MNKEIIKEVLTKYIFDEIGETRPYIDPNSIDDIANDIITAINNKTR